MIRQMQMIMIRYFASPEVAPKRRHKLSKSKTMFHVPWVARMAPAQASEPAPHQHNPHPLVASPTRPPEETINKIKAEYLRLIQWGLIPVLGQPKSGKSSIIEAILSAKCGDAVKPTHLDEELQLLNECKEQMTASDYDMRLARIKKEMEYAPLKYATVDEFKKKMTLSQYDLDFAIVNERMQADYAQSAARNLKYFPLFKDDWDPTEQYVPKVLYHALIVLNLSNL